MKTYKFGKEGVLVRGDFLDAVEKVKPYSVDLVFADPPFNIGYSYDEYKDEMPRSEYYAWTTRWVHECWLRLKKTGSMFVAIGDEYVGDVQMALEMTGMTMRNWIIWHYTFGVYCKGKFGRDHAHILYYVKDPKRFKFYGDRIRVPSARQTKYNDKRADSAGRVPGDVWQFPRICGTFKERTGHPCQMPSALLERVLAVATDPGDVVLDPFCGSGTTAAVCAQLNRRFITTELSRAYALAAAERVSKVIKDRGRQ